MLKKITKNSSYLAVSAVAEKGIYFFWSAWIARSLGADLFGQFNYFTAFTILFTFIPDFGAGLILVRQISRGHKDHKKNFSIYRQANIYLALLTLVLIPLIFYLTNSTIQNSYLIVLASTMFVFGALRNPSVIFLQGKEAMKKLAVFQTLNVAAPAVISFLALMVNRSLTNLFTGQILGLAISFAAITHFTNKKYPLPRYKFDLSRAKSLLTLSLPLGLAALFSMITAKIDIIIIVKLLSSTSLGLFAVANSLLTGVLGIFSNTFSMASLPALAKFSSRITIAKIGIFAVITSLFLTSSIYLFSPLVIPFFFGDSYTPSIVIAQILSFSLIFIFINRLFEQVLLVKHREKIFLMVSIVGAVVTVSANLVFIPRFGIKGAAFAKLASQALMSAILALIIYQQFLSTRGKQKNSMDRQTKKTHKRSKTLG